MSQHMIEACSLSLPMPKPLNGHLGAMMYLGGTLLTAMFLS